MTKSNGPEHRAARAGARRRGFTLVELVVVIAVLAVLACILLPTVHLARRQAQRTNCAGNLRQLGHSYHLYADAHKGKYPDPIAAGMWPVGNLGGTAGEETKPHAIALMFVTGHLSNPRVAYCPGKPAEGVFGWETLEKHWKPGADRKAPRNWQEVYSGYALYAAWHLRLTKDIPNYDQVAQDAKDAPEKVMATDLMVTGHDEHWNNHPPVPVPGQPIAAGLPAAAGGGAALPYAGGNVLRNDGRVEWRDGAGTMPRFGPERLGFGQNFCF